MPRSSRTTAPLPLRLLRAVASLVALSALVAGVPALLLVAGTLPSHLPSAGEIGTALISPDDGLGVLFTLLTLVAWGLWLWFCAATCLEAAALLRRRPTRPSRGFGAPQRLAAFLLGGLLVLPAGTAAMAAQPAAAVTAVHVPQQTTTFDSDGAAAAASLTGQSAAPGPVHVVGEVPETVWGIAQSVFGDGRRSADIRALNPQLPQSAVLPAGTVVQLPSDARTVSPAAADVATAPEARQGTARHASAPVAPDRQADATQTDTQREDGASAVPASSNTPDGTREYTVQHGDNLSGIALKETGDAANWPQLFEANEGEAQPHGHHFTDPDLIYPGQELTLPGDAAGEQQKKPAAPADDPDQHANGERDHAAGTEDQDGASAEAPEEAAGTGSSPAPATTTPAPSTTTPASSLSPTPAEDAPAQPSPTAPPTAAPSDASPSAAVPPAPAADPSEQGAGRHAGVFGLAATGVLAAGFLGLLGYRRLTQLRRRRRSHHIALPDSDAAHVEHALSVTEALLDTAVLDPILRTMAVHLADADRELPEVTAILLGDRDIVLYLAQPAAPVPPFTAAPDQLSRWTCPTNTSELLAADETGDVDEPYPALVSLGWDTDGRLVLIDLDHVGHLHLSGPGAHAVLRTLALELATTEFAHHLDLTLVGDALAPGLADELGERVTQRADLSEALAALRTHHGEQQRALALLGATTLRQARTGVDTAAAWTPSLVIAHAPEDTDGEDDVHEAERDAFEGLLAVVADQPRSATAVLSVGAGPADAFTATGWVLHADPDAGPVRLPIDGVDIDCTLQALSDEHYAYALEILTVSRGDDVPAPQPDFLGDAGTADPLPQADADTAPESAEAAPVDAGMAAPAGPAPVPNLLAEFATYEEEGEGSSDRNQVVEEAGDAGRDADGGALAAAGAARPAANEAGRDEEAAAVSLDKPASAAHSPGSVPAQLPAGAMVSVRLPQTAPAGMPAAGIGASAPGTEAEDLDLPHPVVRVLGPVDVVGTRGSLTEKKRQRTYTELAVWLALHPGHHPGALDHRALDEALWPDKDEVSVKYRNAVVSRTRTWLGRDDSDQPYIPLLKTADSRYSISPAVGCDWHDFQRLVQAGKDPRTEHADLALSQALELVRGRPFSSTDRRRYKWAEHLALVMTMEIVDTAEILAERRLAAQDPRGALWAATKGLEVAPAVESLHRILFQAYAAIGDYESLERAATWLEEWTENNELELDDETLVILDQLRMKA